MTNEPPKNSNLLITQDHEIDLSRATYSTNLSSASIDDETQSFHITIDKILYKHPIEVIEKVLHANGFSLNLENILACMDDFKIGATVELENKVANKDSEPLNFIHCIQFKLPHKTSGGSTLSKFYAEIESYESIIADLKGDPVNKISHARRDDENRRKIETLEAENKSLKEELDSLYKQMDSVIKSREKATEALETQNILPTNVRRATVREVNIEERVIILKSGRTTINLPFFMSSILPHPGDQCLVHVEEGNTLGCFFFNKQRKTLQAQLARVVLVKNNLCKIRDENRNTWLIRAKNNVELEFFRSLKSNDFLLLYMLDNKPLRFEALLRPSVKSHADVVQEAVLVYQIENKKEAVKKDAKDGQDDIGEAK